MTSRPARALLVAALCLSLCGPALAGSADVLVQTAREQAQAGQDATAGASLEAAYQAGARNADLCLAAARLWRRAGEKGRLVLWLARAHRLEPGNQEARKALDAAGVELPGPDLLLGRTLPPRGLVWLALAANTVWWLGLAVARLRDRRPARSAVLLGGLVVGWLWLEAALPAVYRISRPHGVVLSDTAARCAPESEAEVLFSLPAGQMVALGPSRDGQRQVTAGGDRVGWLPSAALAALDP
jgi:hypothetical protein